jgi:hypothetical protein
VVALGILIIMSMMVLVVALGILVIMGVVMSNIVLVVRYYRLKFT